jgi:hypothetical protein
MPRPIARLLIVQSLFALLMVVLTCAVDIIVLYGEPVSPTTAFWHLSTVSWFFVLQLCILWMYRDELRGLEEAVARWRDAAPDELGVKTEEV